MRYHCVAKQCNNSDCSKLEYHQAHMQISCQDMFYPLRHDEPDVSTVVCMSLPLSAATSILAMFSHMSILFLGPTLLLVSDVALIMMSLLWLIQIRVNNMPVSFSI